MSLPAIIKTGTNVYKIGTELIKVVPKLAKKIDDFLSKGGNNPQIKQKLIKEMKPKGLGKKGQVLASVIDQAEKERLRKDGAAKKKKAQREFNEKEEKAYEASKIPPMPKPTTVEVRKTPKRLIEPKVPQPKVKVKPKAPKPKAPAKEKAPYGTNLFGFALGDPDKPDEPDFFDSSTSVDDLEQYDKDIAAYNKRKGLRKGGKVGKKKAGCRAGYGKAMRGY